MLVRSYPHTGREEINQVMIDVGENRYHAYQSLPTESYFISVTWEDVKWMEKSRENHNYYIIARIKQEWNTFKN